MTRAKSYMTLHLVYNLGGEEAILINYQPQVTEMIPYWGNRFAYELCRNYLILRGEEYVSRLTIEEDHVLRKVAYFIMNGRLVEEDSNIYLNEALKEILERLRKPDRLWKRIINWLDRIHRRPPARADMANFLNATRPSAVSLGEPERF